MVFRGLNCNDHQRLAIPNRFRSIWGLTETSVSGYGLLPMHFGNFRILRLCQSLLVSPMGRGLLYSRTLVGDSSGKRQLFSPHVSALGRGAERPGSLLLDTSFLAKKEVVEGGAFDSAASSKTSHRLQGIFPHYSSPFDQDSIQRPSCVLLCGPCK